MSAVELEAIALPVYAPSADPSLLSPAATIARLEAIYTAERPIGFDSEGHEWPTCLGFADSSSSVIVVDTLILKGHPQAAPIWQLMQAIIESDRIVKACWNASHERAFLQSSLGWTLRRYEDAMFSWHERWPELRKGLKYAASILTRFPCWTTGISWKDDDDRPAAAGPKLWNYNAFDCAATLALYQHPQLQLPPPAHARYLDNLALIEPFNYASQKGVRFDHAASDAIRARLTPRLWEAQAKVDTLAGVPALNDAAAVLAATAASPLCSKVQLRKQLAGWKERVAVVDATGEPVLKKGKVVKETLEHPPRSLSWTLCLENANKECAADIRRLKELSACDALPPASQAEAHALLGTGLNVKSTPAVTSLLNRLGLPPVFKAGSRKPTESDDEGSDSAPAQTKDASALLSLFLRTGHPITTAILETVALRGRLQELERKVDSDGRIRSSYTICGPSTDRTASHAWLTGSGGNVQTVPRQPENFRICYCADPSHLWFKLDLTGADLWTVAARVALEGDRTMLDDLRAGIRIPSLIGLMLEHAYRPGSDRAVIKADCVAYRAELKRTGTSWKDTVWKKGGHLTNYGGSAKRIRQSVIEDTYAETGTPVDPGLDLCKRVQTLYLGRYWGVPKWWSRVAGTILRTGKLIYATGREREFLSRRPIGGCLDDATKREALAAEPQAITTWVIKQGVLNLWRDLENWPSGVVGEGEPIVQPLIPCVHDEATQQAPVDKKDWTVAKLKQWFSIPLTIGRENLTIPFEMGVGLNWGDCEKVD